MKYTNNVNNLSGSDWLKNAVNFWQFDRFDIEDIYNRFFAFCYKNRTDSGYLRNIQNVTVEKSDFSFNRLNGTADLEPILNTVIAGAFNSYHVVFLENEIIDGNLIAPYFTRNLDIDGIEYRGKFIIHCKAEGTICIALMFLNRLKSAQNVLAVFDALPLKNVELNQYVIESRSKIDKIGLKHPAPYSYIDVKKLIEIENINDSTILDPFLGVGSTIIGTYESNRNIGIELNPEYVNLIPERFSSLGLPAEAYENSRIICGDSLAEVDGLNETIDAVITSPPYFNILKNNTSGVRTDNSQTRQGVEYYSELAEDIGNVNDYSAYLDAMRGLFTKIKVKMRNHGKIFLIISDFTINKREKDIHSDFVDIMTQCGYYYAGTSYLFQNQKAIYPFGYPFKLVINHIYQYVVKFEVIEDERQ